VLSSKEWEEADRFEEELHVENTAVLETAIFDVAHADDILKADDTPFNRRTFVRVLFSAFEAILYSKQRLLLGLIQRDWDRVHRWSNKKMFNPGSAKISYGELVALSETDYQVENGGKVKSQPRFALFLGKLRLVLDSERKFYGNPSPINYSDVGWQRFQEAQQIRNRLTHPRNAGDLEVSDDELKIVLASRKWFAEAAYF
jgi:hypothetical protein